MDRNLVQITARGPGQQMRDDFYNGPGRAGKWEVIFTMDGPAEEKYVFQQLVSQRKNWSGRARVKILYFISDRAEIFIYFGPAGARAWKILLVQIFSSAVLSCFLV